MLPNASEDCNMSVMWMVRAGRGGVLFQQFLDAGYVAVGWIGLGNLSDIANKEDLSKRYASAYPNGDALNLSRIRKFRFDIRVGDKVVTYDPEHREYGVGTIESEYLYQGDSPRDYNHIRKVKWSGNVSRDILSPGTKNSLNPAATLFQPSESAQRELLSIAEGRTPEVPALDEEPAVDPTTIREDISGQARELIKDKMLQLSWEQMQDLVAGVLRAMGYKTRVSPPGPDKGQDVLASPDGWGFEQPRIRVQVKHKQGTIGAPEMRSFIGGLRSGDRGLYVSTGGFTKEAKYEAERASTSITQVSIDELAELLIQNYDNIDSETRALIPLAKVYWPA